MKWIMTIRFIFIVVALVVAIVLFALYAIGIIGGTVETMSG